MDTAPDAKANSEETKATNPKSRLRMWFVVLVVVLSSLGTLGLFGYRPLLVWYIQREAKARGVELVFQDFSLTRDHVVLKDSHVKLIGLEFLDIDVKTVDVELADDEPKRLDCKGLRVVASEGPIQEQLRQALRWADEHAEVTRLPLVAEGSFLMGASGSDSDVGLLWLQGKAASDAQEQSFEGDVVVKGKPLGLVVAKRDAKGLLSLGLGTKTLVDAPLSATIDTKAEPLALTAKLGSLSVSATLDMKAEPMKVTVKLPSTSVAALFQAASMPVPPSAKNAKVEGTTTLALGPLDKLDKLKGTASFVLTQFVPPHPRELDGIVFGKNTLVGATYEVDPDFKQMKLEKATLEAGALKLAGPGTVTREGMAAKINLDLKGTLSCSELGASAVSSHVRGLVGDLLKGAIRFGVGGTVGVRILVEADTRAMDKMKADPSVDIRCRI